ncbi:MAG: hypothetical protein CVU87_08510 [Firmicutes bacterium HGW-Firmicutes-12]|nr:MAG: hypothetical protein CVU87_08510 [Firmicutes bacterium HGW-Firmicutes-12]
MAEDKELQDYLKKMQDKGIELVACKACAGRIFNPAVFLRFNLLQTVFTHKICPLEINSFIV